MAHRAIPIAALGSTVSTALAVLFVIALLLGLFVPLRYAHGLVEVFADAAAYTAPLGLDSIVGILSAALTAMAAAIAYLRVLVR